MLNGIDKYIQRITVCFLYPDITDLNNNEIDDFQELFLNLLLDIKDGLCNIFFKEYTNIKHLNGLPQYVIDDNGRVFSLNFGNVADEQSP